jgi:putative oxidoreductase
VAQSAGKTSVDIGLLMIRIGIGALFIVFGIPKFAGGADKWAELGHAMGLFGINYAPEFWGFMCAFAEAVGGAALILGIWVRPFAAMLFINMIVAATLLLHGAKHPFTMESFGAWSRPVELAFVFFGLLIAGGGRFCLLPSLLKSGGAKK